MSEANEGPRTDAVMITVIVVHGIVALAASLPLLQYP